MIKIASPNFRQIARASLARAKAELATNDPHRARYAALELRDCIEAVTYDRALAFKDDIPPEEYKTWQPRKLMSVLIEIDPTIGFSATISFGEEKADGSPPEMMHVLGTDTPLTLKDIKTEYDALGSYLHMPSLDQVITGKLPDQTKLRERCDRIIAAVDKVLRSQVWNSTFGKYTTLATCANEECKQPIRRRIPNGQKTLDVRCFACDAEYRVSVTDDGKVFWKPVMEDVCCANPDCNETAHFWLHQIKPGTNWVCSVCTCHNEITLGVRIVTAAISDAKSLPK